MKRKSKQTCFFIHTKHIFLDVIGEVTDSGRIVVTGTESECVVNLPLKGINPPVKLYDFVSDVEAKVDEFPR